MWVIFEGLDKAGKGTLEREFLKATNYKHVVIDRGPAGYAVFDYLFNRITDEGTSLYARNLSDMTANDNFVVIYCKVSADVAMQRINEHNEVCPYDYEYAQNVYDIAVKTLYELAGIKVIKVDTIKSINECINLILGGLK